MAENASVENVVQTTTTGDDSGLGFPREQLEVEEGGISEDNINYPTGSKLWLTMTSLCVTFFINGLVCSHGRGGRMVD